MLYNLAARGSMIAGETGGATLSHGNMYFSGWKGRKGSGLERQLPLDQRTLPFVLGGELSFSVGVNLKMAATRWTDWAADIGLRNDKGSPEEGCVSLRIILIVQACNHLFRTGVNLYTGKNELALSFQTSHLPLWRADETCCVQLSSVSQAKSNSRSADDAQGGAD